MLLEETLVIQFVEYLPSNASNLSRVTRSVTWNLDDRCRRGDLVTGMTSLGEFFILLIGPLFGTSFSLGDFECDAGLLGVVGTMPSWSCGLAWIQDRCGEI